MSYFVALPPKVANGNISPRRFLTTVTGAGNGDYVVQASASTAMIWGVSYDATKYPPGSPADNGFLCTAGEPCPYHGFGQMCQLDIGGTVSNVGVPLTSDGNGKGIAQAPADGTTCWYGAIALQTGVDGDTINVVTLAPTPTV